MNLDALKKIGRPQQLIIVGAATAVIAGAFIWFSLGTLNEIGADPDLPAWMRREAPGSLWEQVCQARDSTQALQETIRKRPQVQAQLDAMKADIAAAKELLPSQAEKAIMRETIDRLAAIEPGVGTVRIKSVSIREAAAAATGRGAKGGPSYQNVEYVLQVVCDLDGLISFIDRIEKYDRFMSVDSFQLQSGGVQIDKDSKKPVNGLHQVNMKVITYVYSAGTGK